jgi:hypothetical protein
VRLRRTVERGICEHDQPYICAASDDGGLFPRLFRGALGNEGVSSVDSGRGHWFFFLVGGVGNGKRRCQNKTKVLSEGCHGPRSSSYVHSMSRPQTD